MAGSLPNDEALAALYPPWLRVVHVQIVHRHGERSAMFNPFRTLRWQTADGRGLCAIGSTLDRLTSGGGIGAGGAVQPQPVQLQFEDRARRGAAACLPGQLTDVGRARMHALGARLRTVYVDRLHVLPPTYDPAVVRVRSTVVPRAIESVQALAAGLFPATAQALQVVVREEQSEFLFPNWVHCPQLRALNEAMREQLHTSHRSELVRVRELLGADLLKAPELGGRPATAHDMYDALSSARAHGLPLPAAVTPELYAMIEDMAVDHWWTPFVRSEAIARLGIGRLIGDLLGNMLAAAGPAAAGPGAISGVVPAPQTVDAAGLPLLSGHGVALNLMAAAHPQPSQPPQPKQAQRLCLYSAHDSTVAPLLAAFRVFDGLWPDFGAHLTFELLEARPPTSSTTSAASSPTHVVRLLYNHRPLAVPQCAAAAAAAGVDGTLCPLQRFREIAAALVPANHHRECQLAP